MTNDGVSLRTTIPTMPCAPSLSRGVVEECRYGGAPHNPLRWLKMTAPRTSTSDVESSSSSNSDVEELARCREAAMPAWGLEQRPREREQPRAGRGLCSGSLAEGRRVFLAAWEDGAAMWVVTLSQSGKLKYLNVSWHHSLWLIFSPPPLRNDPRPSFPRLQHFYTRGCHWAVPNT